MKLLLAITVLFFFFSYSNANEIDSLKTQRDVERFLIEKVNKKFKDDPVFYCDIPDTCKYGKSKFLKIDLDNNGLTDLIVDGRYLFIVADNGNGHYKISSVDRGSLIGYTYTLSDIIYRDKTPLLVVSPYSKFNFVKQNQKTDTLVYKFGDLFEYNEKADNLKIGKIRMSTGMCFGTCPVFELTIDEHRNVKYNAINYNNKKGVFFSKIDEVTYQDIINTINYIKLNSLKDNYSVNWTDDQTAKLEISLEGGVSKTISDYGMIGTYGLISLYAKLSGLRYSQKWHR